MAPRFTEYYKEYKQYACLGCRQLSEKLVNLDLKSHLIGLATSKQVKELVCDLIDNYVHHSDNTVDDALARAVRAALLGDDAG